MELEPTFIKYLADLLCVIPRCDDHNNNNNKVFWAHLKKLNALTLL